MICCECQENVVRVRIIESREYCHACLKRAGRLNKSNRVLGLLSGNPYNPSETVAYKEDLETRYVPSGSTEWDRWRGPGNKIFI